VSPVTHKQPDPDLLFLEPKDHNKETIEKIPCMFLAHLPSVAVMALDRRVLKEGDILCELYADTCSNVSDDSEGEFPTASSHKQFQLPAVVHTSDSDTNTEEEENSESDSSDVWCETDNKPSSESESSDVWCETDKNPNSGPLLGTSGVNIVIYHPVSVAGVVNTIVGADLIQLLTEQSNLYHRQN
jgi:hypothetical protein